jgi:hypothetical protein
MKSFEEINNKNYIIILGLRLILALVLFVSLYLLFNEKKLNHKYFMLLVFIMPFSVFIHFILAYYLTKFETVITIKEKITPMYGKYSIYRIVDNNNNIFELRDNILLWDFNSANDYVSIEEGKKYKIHGYGARINILSLYPIIHSFNTNINT